MWKKHIPATITDPVLEPITKEKYTERFVGQTKEILREILPDELSEEICEVGATAFSVRVGSYGITGEIDDIEINCHIKKPGLYTRLLENIREEQVLFYFERSVTVKINAGSVTFYEDFRI